MHLNICFLHFLDDPNQQNADRVSWCHLLQAHTSPASRFVGNTSLDGITALTSDEHTWFITVDEMCWAQRIRTQCYYHCFSSTSHSLWSCSPYLCNIQSLLAIEHNIISESLLNCLHLSGQDKKKKLPVILTKDYMNKDRGWVGLNTDIERFGRSRMRGGGGTGKWTLCGVFWKGDWCNNFRAPRLVLASLFAIQH